MFLSHQNYHPHLIFHAGWWCFWHISKTCIWSCFSQQCIKGLHGPALFLATIHLGINVKGWKNDHVIKMLGETCVLFSAYYSYSKSSQKCYSKEILKFHFPQFLSPGAFPLFCHSPAPPSEHYCSVTVWEMLLLSALLKDWKRRGQCRLEKLTTYKRICSGGF